MYAIRSYYAGRPGFPRVLRTLHEAWTKEPEKLRGSAAQVTQRIGQMASPGSAEGAPPGSPDELMSQALARLRSDFDSEHGGFGRRITSYNVCYTKLLRGSRLAASPDGQSAAAAPTLLFQNPSVAPEGKDAFVGPEALQPGDILLTSTPGFAAAGIELLTIGAVSHAAVYIGDGRIVEAVVITSYSIHYTKLYESAHARARAARGADRRALAGAARLAHRRRRPGGLRRARTAAGA